MHAIESSRSVPSTGAALRLAGVQGVGGIATVATSTGAVQVSEGLNGFGFGATGIGVSGESDQGYGLVGGSGGIDIAALGNGRILQATALDSMLSNPPAGPPSFKPNDFEQLRDGNGVLWVSHQAPTGSPATAYWRRLNSTIPIVKTRRRPKRSPARPLKRLSSRL